ncbi:MAG: NADPH:quinone oxidoreductase family protein [Acidimicrobiia bacterium]
MRAWRVHELGDPEKVMSLEEIEPPVPGAGQVLLEVEAAALNFPDILVCQGRYQERADLPFTPGIELVGRVIDHGPGGSNLELGQRVIGLAAFGTGSLAEQSLADTSGVFPVPDDFLSVRAAAVHVAYQTGYLALHRRAGLRAGETLLVHAAAGGVGSAAVQLGLAAGARVIATAGGPEKVEVCRRLGAHLAIDYTAGDFVGAVKEATDGRGADVIYDPVGGEVFDRSRRCVAFEGRILVVGFTSGRIADAPTNHALVKNYSVVGVHWGLYGRVMPEMHGQIHQELLRLHAAGHVDPLISSVVPLEEAVAGLVALGSRKTYGRVLCDPRR